MSYIFKYFWNRILIKLLKTEDYKDAKKKSLSPFFF